MENANVSIPGLSTREIATNEAELRYRVDDGTIHHLKTGHKTEFIAAGGVYFVKIFLPKRVTQGKCKDLLGFGRQD